VYQIYHLKQVVPKLTNEYLNKNSKVFNQPDEVSFLAPGPPWVVSSIDFHYHCA